MPLGRVSGRRVSGRRSKGTRSTAEPRSQAGSCAARAGGPDGGVLGPVPHLRVRGKGREAPRPALLFSILGGARGSDVINRWLELLSCDLKSVSSLGSGSRLPSPHHRPQAGARLCQAGVLHPSRSDKRRPGQGMKAVSERKRVGDEWPHSASHPEGSFKRPHRRKHVFLLAFPLAALLVSLPLLL